MPELPEVETIRQQLSRHLPLTIEEEWYSNVSTSIVKVKNFSPVGLTIKKLSRIGKVLHFIFSNDLHILSGLGMSGAWRYSKSKIEEKHTHIQFRCTNKSGELYLAYVDPRRFGKSYFVDALDCKARLEKLGVDISSDDFTGDYILALAKKYPERIIKPFLLDQKFFAGIGNYIASEMLAHARILPTREMGSLSKKEAQNLSAAAKLVISGSVESRGLTFAGGYTDAHGEKGEGLNNLVVFHQQICGLCQKHHVCKVVLAGRATFYCPKCQK